MLGIIIFLSLLDILNTDLASHNFFLPKPVPTSTCLQRTYSAFLSFIVIAAQELWALWDSYSLLWQRKSFLLLNVLLPFLFIQGTPIQWFQVLPKLPSISSQDFSLPAQARPGLPQTSPECGKVRIRAMTGHQTVLLLRFSEIQVMLKLWMIPLR